MNPRTERTAAWLTMLASLLTPLSVVILASQVTGSPTRAASR
jgi:hypothetical protein